VLFVQGPCCYYYKNRDSSFLLLFILNILAYSNSQTLERIYEVDYLFVITKGTRAPKKCV